ncbi:NIF-domain-containing protein [Dichomitus squalens LYAD-421 SS1]|uniref:Mitochondrial import inner membrane translocase subunit TIM50 n=1 Tax=Dichomitus squalens (strain LYAD-421) TaxID=732165 RepID=R7SY66_DICSQ|nr:NIF-domain-containing protein [Dichomitus squalens LYAD-421 SS1]EJF60655.1 NIF-domain-containing protein [Dichomitus squalens LYAD-421 SS1]
MLQAAFRLPVARSFASQSVRTLASKSTPKNVNRPLPTKPAPPPPPPSGAKLTNQADAPKPIPSSSVVPSLDFDPEGPESGDANRERTGAKSSKDSLSSIERRRQFMGRVSLAMLLAGAGAVTWIAGRPWEEDELKAKKLSPEEAAKSTRWERTKARFTGIFDTFTEPLWPELLPPPLQGEMYRPYTLLVSVDDLLVTSTWDRQHGWRTAKRPGVDYFLAYMSQFYEIVVFTTQYHYTAMPILDKLDPYQFYIIHRLFRDACRSENGQPVKDLSYLNRDLSKVILLDTHPEHVKPNPENAIILPKWTGDAKDRGLVAMIPFLESIAIFRTPDVRPVLKAYEGKNIPIEYAKKEAEMKRKHLEEYEHSRKGLSRGGFTFGALFGGSEQPSAASHAPLTYLEQKRLEAQRRYLEEQEYLKQNKETLDKMIKEQEEALQREMPSTFWGATQAILSGGPPPAPPPGQQQQQPAQLSVEAK